jgi:spore maturation protein B
MDAFRDALSVLSVFVLPILLVGFPLYGLYKRVPVYEAFVGGAKEGFEVAVRIIPYLVAILFAIAMFRASGAMDAFVGLLSPLTSAIGIPGEVLPMAILRPLTGSGSAAIVADMIAEYGEDSLLVKMAATMYGSSETTFYVLAVYFGAVSVTKTRHAVPVGLLADFIGFVIAIYVVRLLFG